MSIQRERQLQNEKYNYKYNLLIKHPGFTKHYNKIKTILFRFLCKEKEKGKLVNCWILLFQYL